MAVKLYVKVIAYDEDAGFKATREGTVDVPRGIIAMQQKILGEDTEEMLGSISTSALASAIQSVSSSNAVSGPLPGSTGPVIGGGSGRDPLAEALNLDLIDHMSGQEAASQRRQGPPGQRRWSLDRR